MKIVELSAQGMVLDSTLRAPWLNGPWQHRRRYW